MDRPMRSSQIGYDPTLQQQKSWAVQISKLPGDGRITELRIHICRFDDTKGQCFGFGACIVGRSLPQSMHRFISCSTHKGHSQNEVLSSLTVMPLLPSGALLLSNRTLALQASDAWADLSDGTAITSSLFLFLVFLALFLRKIRDLQQRFLTDAAHHLSYQR